MSKINDNQIGVAKVVDRYKEHIFHSKVDKKCSDCYGKKIKSNKK